MALIYDWCEERLEIQSIADDILGKFVPAHVNIFYCLGGILRIRMNRVIIRKANPGQQ